MKIFIVAITFAVTVGGLFLFENYKTQPKEENYAQIIQSLNSRPQISSSPAIAATPISTRTPSPVIPIRTSVPLPTPFPTPAFHLFYTSSYTTAKYYYCDTDTDWKNLSTEYLKVFSSSEELLRAYSTRTLHELCK